MKSPRLGNGIIDESTGTPPGWSLPKNCPPVPHIAICMTTDQPIPAAAVDRVSKRRIKKGDAFALGLFFSSLWTLYFSLKSPHSGHHFAIALGLKSIIIFVTAFLYICSCFSNPGLTFLKMQVILLVFCVGLFALDIFLTRHA